MDIIKQYRVMSSILFTMVYEFSDGTIKYKFTDGKRTFKDMNNFKSEYKKHFKRDPDLKEIINNEL